MHNIEKFDDIRVFFDSEVRGVLDGLVAETEFVDAIASMRFPRYAKIFRWPLRTLVRRKLKHMFAGVDTVEAFQMLVKDGIDHLLESTKSKVTVTGIEHLQPDKAYLFISNHRDIAMDPAYVNYALKIHGFDTVRIAIGDNLLSKKYISDLIRVNKSFVVKRSVSGRRAKLEALKTLSEYIRLSLLEDKSHVWIAQREGRAKDGNDKTETALLKMLGLSREAQQSFGDAMVELNIVPVAVSYQFDPCDRDKARELHAVCTVGSYQKKPHEDLRSIYKGIAGYKGHIHLAFDRPISGGFEDDEELAAMIDKSIIGNYFIHATNLLAYEMQEGEDEYSKMLRASLPDINWPEVTRLFSGRVADCEPDCRSIMLDAYANPVRAKKRLEAV